MKYMFLQFYFANFVLQNNLFQGIKVIVLHSETYPFRMQQ